MDRQNSQNTGYQALRHQKNVVSAIYAYCGPKFMTISILANQFHVSENTISNWFCEAVEKRYVASDAICYQVMAKHIKEYEEKHLLVDSSLRTMYQLAFEARGCPTPSISTTA